MDHAGELCQAVERIHRCHATFMAECPVMEESLRQTVYEGSGSVFKLEGHPTATRCYAWATAVENSTKLRYHAVLKVPPVTTVEEALHTAITRDHRSSG